jgi:hypothetical protein
MATEVHQSLTPVRGLSDRLSVQRLLIQLTPFALALAAFVAAFLVMRPETTGDEPHYLLVAESIAFDGDVDLTNDYASRERTLRVVNVFPLDPAGHAAEYNESGKLRPLHGVGLPALLSPAVGLGGLTGAQLAMVLIAALMADQLFRLLRDFGFRRRYRVAAWVAVVFCSPILVFSSQVYPEIPAALLLVVALRVTLTGARSPAALALGSAAAAALVWLHVRYIPLSFGVLLGLAVAACAARQTGTGHPGQRRLVGRIMSVLRSYAVTAWKDWRTVTLPVLGPYIAGLGLVAIAFAHWYGTPSPTAPYRATSSTNVGDGGWAFLYEYTLADILSPVHGWIPYVPVHWLGLAALGCLVFRFGWPASLALAVAVGYELILSSAAPNVGWGLPARYLIIVIPLIAIPTAVVIQHVPVSRLAFVPLLAVSLVFSVAAVRDHQGLFPIDDDTRIFGVKSISPVFPIPRPPHPPTSYEVTPGQFGPATGRLANNNRLIVARPDRDVPGLLTWGPYSTLKDGTYRATFPLTVRGARPTDQVALIEAAGTPPPKLFARRVVTAAELNSRKPTNVSVNFKMPGGYLTETRLFYLGNGTLRAGPVRVSAVSLEPGRPFSDKMLAAIWFAGTVSIGWLLVRLMKRERRSAASVRNR